MSGRASQAFNVNFSDKGKGKAKPKPKRNGPFKFLRRDEGQRAVPADSTHGYVEADVQTATEGSRRFRQAIAEDIRRHATHNANDKLVEVEIAMPKRPPPQKAVTDATAVKPREVAVEPKTEPHQHPAVQAAARPQSSRRQPLRREPPPNALHHDAVTEEFADELATSDGLDQRRSEPERMGTVIDHRDPAADLAPYEDAYAEEAEEEEDEEAGPPVVAPRYEPRRDARPPPAGNTGDRATDRAANGPDHGDYRGPDSDEHDNYANYFRRSDPKYRKPLRSSSAQPGSRGVRSASGPTSQRPERNLDTDLLERLRELEREVLEQRRENQTLRHRSREAEYRERASEEIQAERDEFEAWAEEERRYLRKEKRTMDAQRRQLQEKAAADRQEAQKFQSEAESLRADVDRLTTELRERDAKWRKDTDRLRRELNESQRRNNELHDMLREEQMHRADAAQRQHHSYTPPPSDTSELGSATGRDEASLARRDELERRREEAAERKAREIEARQAKQDAQRALARERQEAEQQQRLEREKAQRAAHEKKLREDRERREKELELRREQEERRERERKEREEQQRLAREKLTAGQGKVVSAPSQQQGAGRVATTATAKSKSGRFGANRDMLLNHDDGESEPVEDIPGDVITARNENSEGKVERLFKSGKRELTYTNGTRRVILPTNHQILYFNNGDVKKTFPSGKSAYWYDVAETTHIQYPTGEQVFRFHKNKQVEKHHTDGTKEIVFPNGEYKVIHPDGTEEIIDAGN